MSYLSMELSSSYLLVAHALLMIIHIAGTRLDQLAVATIARQTPVTVPSYIDTQVLRTAPRKYRGGVP